MMSFLQVEKYGKMCCARKRKAVGSWLGEWRVVRTVLRVC